MRVDTIHNSRDGAQAAVVVCHPALPVAGVLGQLCQFACLQVQTVGIEHLRVASVHADQYLVGHVFEVVDNRGAYAGKVRIAAQVCAVEVDAIQAVVFIAGRVLHEQQALIVRPHVAGDAALGFGRDLQFLAAIGGADEDVHAVLVGGHKGDVTSIRGYLETGAVGIAEKIF